MRLRVVVTGSGGQLGTCLVKALRAGSHGSLLAAFDRDGLDLGKRDQLAGVFDGLASPDVLVNAAAYTRVDDCEDQQELAHRINGKVPALLAETCRDAGVRLVHLSTDYVFDGCATSPYPVTHPTDPQSVYGHSKLEGEQAVLEASPDFTVVRTSWVFGPGQNFVETMLRLAREQRSGRAQDKMRVVDDQQGCPTYAADLALGLLELASSGQNGLFHLSNAEPTTWWSFARAILDGAGYADIEIEKATSAEFVQKAKRPSYSVLDCSRAAELGISLRPWPQALAAYLEAEHAIQAGASG